jgi:hypothetical protein
MRLRSIALVAVALGAFAVGGRAVRNRLRAAAAERTVEQAEHPERTPEGAREAARSPTHGLTIPPAHPRLWFDAARLERARAWFRRAPFTPDRDDPLGLALRGLLADDRPRCRAALEWALAESKAMRREGTACDGCRWSGEAIIAAYDWCHAALTPAELAEFVAATNAWIEHWRTQPWGAPPMHDSNYYWGYLRNELLWAIASRDENGPAAMTPLLDDVFTRRLAADFGPASRTDGRGGVGREGSQYGAYVTGYVTMPFVTAGLLGRGLLDETPFWREAVYAYVYATNPAGGGRGATLFPFNDDEQWLERDLTSPATAGARANFMAATAMHWSGVAVGRHAREWLALTRAPVAHFVRSVDPGGAAEPFDRLPLDYYAAGPGYLFGRSAWGPSGTAFMLQLGESGGSGHSHVDWGTWQLWRGGQYLSRETVAYGEEVAGAAGRGTISAGLAPGHNALLFGDAGLSATPWVSGAAVVRRLESRPEYAYADVDLTATAAGKRGNPAVAHAEREFVFVRRLETLVVLDRLESRDPATPRTFLAHCETRPIPTERGAICTVGKQALVLTTLAPGAAAIRVVEEGGKVGQYRIEVETSPGTARSSILTILQAKDAAAPALHPSIAEDERTYTVTLDRETRVSFVKGRSSSSGGLEIGGRRLPFTDAVQEMTVSDSGPAWR